MSAESTLRESHGSAGAGVRSREGRRGGGLDGERWRALGAFLSRRDLLLLSERERARLENEWRDLIAQEESLDDRLSVGLVGGTGVGKSTFINALAGRPISRSGDRRPTTDRVIVYRHVRQELPDDLPRDDLSQPQVVHENDAIESLILLDFPDFDSAEEDHREVLSRYISHLDVLLVLVDDVKYGDLRLYELLGAQHHDERNFFVLLNKLDHLEERYGGRARGIADEILRDLREKLARHAGLELAPDQSFALSALAVLERRHEGRDARSPGDFDRVEEFLERYREARRRKAAKTLNLESRKRSVAERLRRTTLSEENRSVLADARKILESWRAELDGALASTAFEVVGEAERRRLRRGRVRRKAPSWGFPFSFLFTLTTEFRAPPEEETALDHGDLAGRIREHYRAFFDSLRNLERRFEAEIAGSPLAAGAAERAETPSAGTVDERELREASHRLAGAFREEFAADVERGGRGSRLLRHLPAIAVLALALWSLVYPAVVVLAEGGAWGQVLSEVGSAALRALNPLLILGLISAVVIVYLLTAVFLWGREAQAVRDALHHSERRLRERVRAMGSATLARLDARVERYAGELGELEELLG